MFFNFCRVLRLKIFRGTYPENLGLLLGGVDPLVEDGRLEVPGVPRHQSVAFSAQSDLDLTPQDVEKFLPGMLQGFGFVLGGKITNKGSSWRWGSIEPIRANRILDSVRVKK